MTREQSEEERVMSEEPRPCGCRPDEREFCEGCEPLDPEPAPPTDGLREEIARWLCNLSTPTWEHSGPMARDSWRAKADDLIRWVPGIQRLIAAEELLRATQNELARTHNARVAAEEERERARAPFLALADRYETTAQRRRGLAHRWQTAERYQLADAFRNLARQSDAAAARIRRAAEESES